MHINTIIHKLTLDKDLLLPPSTHQDIQKLLTQTYEDYWSIYHIYGAPIQAPIDPEKYIKTLVLENEYYRY